MAQGKKGQMYQFMVPMVDATDFASIESAITESDYQSGAVAKFFGVNHGVSTAFTSGTLSKLGRLVRSGIFQHTVKGTENNYDQMLVKIAKTGCADQVITWDNVDNDDSDIMSMLTLIQSLASDAHSAAAQGNSRVLLNQSRISDVYSLLSDFESNLSSRVPKEVAARSQLSDLTSDLRSYLVGISGSVSDIASYLVAMSDSLSDAHSDLRSLLVALSDQLSDAHSDIKSAIGNVSVTITASDISDIASAVAAAVGSSISDIYSQLSDFRSDLLSHIDVTGVQLNASTMSDLRSAITAGGDPSVLSDILSAAQQTNSRVLVNQSRISDVQSYLVAMSDSLSDAHSDIRSILLALSDQLSDANSDLRSLILGNSGTLSDIYSALSNLDSDFQSRVPKRVATDSQLSDLASDIRSYLAGISGVDSDIYSLLTAGVEIGPSSLSDIRSAIAADAFNASDISDIVSAMAARTFTEPSGEPTFSSGADAWMAYWAAVSINKVTQTSSKRIIRNNADNATIASHVVSDDGTTFTDGVAG